MEEQNKPIRLMALIGLILQAVCTGITVLSRLFPNAKQRTYPVVMARLNEPRLFSKLFSCEARTIQEAYRISTKPLMMVETV